MDKLTTRIIAVAGNKKVLKTAEDEANWWFLTPEVTKYLEGGKSGVKAGVTAELEVEKVFENDKEKVTISKITLQEAPAGAKEEKSSNYKASTGAESGDAKTVSIVRQSTLKCACILLSSQDINNAEVVQERAVEVAKRFQRYVDTGE